MTNNRGQCFHSTLIAILVASSLLLRGMIAPGYMPAFGQEKDLWPITICTAQGLSTILVGDQYTPEAPPHKPQKPMCDFAVNSDSVSAAITTSDSPYIPFATQPGRFLFLSLIAFK